MKQVFVNADDFGLHPDLNRAIADGVEAGRIQGLSVSTNGAAVDWELLRSLRDQGAHIGAHITWVDEPWLTGGGGISRLALVRRLATSPGSFGTLLRAEARAQVERLLAQGLPPAHIDSHQHMHVLPGLWPIADSLAREFGIPRIRVPMAPSLAAARCNPGGLILQSLSHARRRSRPDAWPCVGLARSGHNTRAIIARELPLAREPIVELVAHPGYATPALVAQYGHWNYNWEAERRLLMDDGWTEFLAQLECQQADLAVQRSNS